MLSHAIATQSAVTKERERQLTALLHQMQAGTGASFRGMHRSYQPYEEVAEDRREPDKNELVRYTSAQVLEHISGLLPTLWDAVYTRDLGNAAARADVVLEDGTVLIRDCPTIFLGWMITQITDLRTVLTAIPTRPLGVKWERTNQPGIWQSPVSRRIVTEQKPMHKLSEPSDRHPQTLLDKWMSNEPVGQWNDRTLTGAMDPGEHAELLRRVEDVLRALTLARLNANKQEVTPASVSGGLLAYLFPGTV